MKVIPRCLRTLEDANQIKDCAGVFGGLKAGLTSDASAALIARKLRSPLIIVSTVGAIFENDPTQTKSRRLKSVSRIYIKELARQGNGPHVLDKETCKILLKMSKRSVVRVCGPDNIIDVLDGNSENGTKILL